jgi:hypothetical protein
MFLFVLCASPAPVGLGVTLTTGLRNAAIETQKVVTKPACIPQNDHALGRRINSKRLLWRTQF